MAECEFYQFVKNTGVTIKIGTFEVPDEVLKPDRVHIPEVVEPIVEEENKDMPPPNSKVSETTYTRVKTSIDGINIFLAEV